MVKAPNFIKQTLMPIWDDISTESIILGGISTIISYLYKSFS